MHDMYSCKPLCKNTQFVHFALPSVHLQYMEGATSTKVLTSNMTASISYKAKFQFYMVSLERWHRNTQLV